MMNFALNGFPLGRGVYAAKLGLPIVDGVNVTLPLVFDPDGSPDSCVIAVQRGI